MASWPCVVPLPGVGVPALTEISQQLLVPHALLVAAEPSPWLAVRALLAHVEPSPQQTEQPAVHVLPVRVELSQQLDARAPLAPDAPFQPPFARATLDLAGVY